MSEPYPPNPPNNISAPVGGLVGKVWKDRSTKGKVGMVLGALFLASIAASALGDSDTESDAAPTTPAAETTTTESETTTTAQATTTTLAETTTSLTLTPDVLQSVFSRALEETRRDFVSAAEDLFVVESVDLFEYDVETDFLTLDVTPAFDFEPGVRDDAWELTRAFAIIWEVVVPADAVDIWSGPNWRVVVSTATYECSADAMRRLADARLSRDQWESECRVS